MATADLRILYTADLHGNMGHYRKLLFEAVAKQADCIVIGGDLFPRGRWLISILEGQRQFIIDHFKPLLEEFKKVNPGKAIYLMMGNDDFAANMDLLEGMESEALVHPLHMRTHQLTEELSLAGYGCVPPTHFPIKDWERLDAERETVPKRSYQACRSSGSSVDSIDAREWFLSHNTISEDLEMLARLSNPARTIYVIHTPPYATKLDVLHSGRHVGSWSVRDFIEKHGPPLSLHGHIHESHHMTDSPSDRIGDTICVNAGQSEDFFHAVTIDIPGYRILGV